MDELLTFEVLLEKYFYAKTLRPDTQWSYCKVVRTFTKFAKVLPGEVSTDLVLRWKEEVLKVQGLKVRTWNNKVAHMRALFNFAIKKKLFQEENPFNGVVACPGVKRKKTLSDSQLETVYRVMQQQRGREQSGDRYRNALAPAWFWTAVLDILRYTAIRQNQFLHIRISDVDFDSHCIHLRLEGAKNHREHQVPIISALRPSLEELVSQVTKAGAMPHEQLFNIAWFDFRRKANYQDGMTKVPLRSFFRRLSRECGFLVSPHRFRHTIATKLMRTPERNLQTVKTLLGHVSLASTLEYVEVNIESLKATLEQELRW